MHETQPAPTPSTGDIWADLIAREMNAELIVRYERRRALGIKRYGTPLQRGNGRDPVLDCEEEMLDGMAYAEQANRPDIVAHLRSGLEMLLASVPSPAPTPSTDALPELSPWEYDVFRYTRTDLKTGYVAASAGNQGGYLLRFDLTPYGHVKIIDDPHRVRHLLDLELVSQGRLDPTSVHQIPGGNP